MATHDVEVLRAACCIAGLDGQIAADERKALETLAERAGVGGVSLQAMIDRARRDPDFYEDQFRLMRGDTYASMKTVTAVAVADGVLSTEERVVLQHLADRIGLPRAEFDRLLNAAEKYVKLRGASEHAREATSRPSPTKRPPKP